MKLFQQLLVAPAALGLLAPMAATAAELNIDGMTDYSSPSEKVQGISQFSDVYPTDWAYQALTQLAERHGCVAANPQGSMTRYEAAALLNKCLGDVAQANEEERRLLNEFGPELAVIKGRVDGLEARVGEFEAGMFSTTTKLRGQTTFVMGATASQHAESEPDGATEKDATVFNYDTQITLDTSFNGDDLLRTQIRAGNFNSTNSDPFASGDTALEIASSDSNSNNLKISRNYYQFPVGDDFKVTVGAKVRQDDMLAVWPSSYPSDSILDSLTYAGANAAYSLTTGPGAGVQYVTGNVSASVLFVSEEGDGANPATQGLLSTGGSDDVTGQLAWSDNGITIAAVYTVADGGVTDGSSSKDDYEAWGISGVWEPTWDSAWLPTSISAGYGSKSVDNETKYEGDTNRANTDIMDEVTWSVGLEWSDFIVGGNTLGVGVGSAEGWRDESTYSDPMAYEVWYSMPVSDNITVTPALFQVERDDDYAVTGGLIKTTFSF